MLEELEPDFTKRLAAIATERPSTIAWRTLSMSSSTRKPGRFSCGAKAREACASNAALGSDLSRFGPIAYGTGDGRLRFLARPMARPVSFRTHPLRNSTSSQPAEQLTLMTKVPRSGSETGQNRPSVSFGNLSVKLLIRRRLSAQESAGRTLAGGHGSGRRGSTAQQYQSSGIAHHLFDA